VAASNTFVSNLARGGTLSPVSEAVARSNLPSGVRAGINTKLRTAALSIAKSVDATIDGHFAELGVDLAVDAAGRVWLLEVNSKPSKEDNTPSGDSKIRPSVKQVVLYSQHAWGK
jgi:glutathione synthase/RimK-type ligase-like ATP-grasp enzyme